MATSEADKAHPLQILTKKEYRILQAAVERIVPEAGSFPGLNLALKIDQVLSICRKELARDLKLLLFLLEYGTPILGFKFKRFTQMSPEEKDRYLFSWEHSALPFKRTGFQAIKRSALAAFYGSEESWSGIGYRGPWLSRGYSHDYEGKGIQVPG